MYKIVDKQCLAEKVWKYVVRAPKIARKRKPGQFVILRVHEQGERIRLTIAGGDPTEGTITLIAQAVGKTTEMMADLDVGYELANLVLTGRLVTEAALLREESRGAHFRSDFPQSSPQWQRHIIFTKKKGQVR